MDLYEYLKPIRKWWWLLVAATIVAAVSSSLATLQEAQVYQSHTTLMIGRTIDDPNPTSGQFTLAQQLADSYADIANREGVRKATMDVLGTTWLPEYLASALPNSQLIDITVTDTDPARAQAVAAELANQLILAGPSGINQEERDRQAFINQQLDDLELQIQEAQDDIAALQSELGTLTSARQISDTRSQIRVLETKLTDLQRNYGTLLSNTERGAVNTLTVIEPANLPLRPVNENKLITILSASAIGLMLATGAAYLLEYLDKSIKSPDEAERIFNAQVIGYIAEISESSGKPFILENPRSTIAEAFRSLRTNLEFAAVGEPLQTILVSSAGPDAGKTSVASNLAISIAQGGKKVILIDSDLRRPGVHQFFGIPNMSGLGDIFQGNLDPHDAITLWDENRLSILTAGSHIPNPAEILGSRLMDNLILTATELADVVIIDGPPFLVADASILASKVDGVLVVIRPGHTHREAAESMAEQIERVGARVVGLTLNRIPRGSADYYGRYWYYAPEYTSPYFGDEGQDEKLKSIDTNGRKSLPGVLRRFTRSKDKKMPIKTDLKNTVPLIKETRGANPSPATKQTDRLGLPTFSPSPPKAFAVLKWEDHLNKRQKLVLREGDTILIGRDRINDVIIQSRHVSRRHAVITWRKGIYEIADLGSTNGTYVNGVPADRPLILEDGDAIRLFDIELIFKTLKKAGEPGTDVESQLEVDAGGKSD